MTQQLEDTKLTLANLWKILVVSAFLVGSAGYFYRLESKVEAYNTSAKAEICLMKTELSAKIDQMKQEQLILHATIEKKLAEQDKRQEASDKAFTDLSKTVDRAATVLERIDNKMNKP